MDLTTQITDAINAWLQNLATQLLSPALAAAGQLLFTTPEYDRIPEIAQTWSLVRNIADALLVLALVAAGILVMASGTFDARYTAKLLVPRVVLAAVVANASLAICGALIGLDNALVIGLLGPNPASSTIGQLAAMVESGHAVNQVVGMLVALAAAVLAVLLVALYIGRDLLLLLATVLAPLALATYALPQTDELARLWWRAYGALLFVQVVQAVLIEVGVELLRHTDWLGGPIADLTAALLLVTLLYLLFRLPFTAYQWAFRQQLPRNPLVQTVIVAGRSAGVA